MSAPTPSRVASVETAPSLFGDPNLVLFNSGDQLLHTASQPHGASGYVGRHRVDSDVH